MLVSSSSCGFHISLGDDVIYNMYKTKVTRVVKDIESSYTGAIPAGNYEEELITMQQDAFKESPPPPHSFERITQIRVVMRPRKGSNLCLGRRYDLRSD